MVFLPHIFYRIVLTAQCLFYNSFFYRVILFFCYKWFYSMLFIVLILCALYSLRCVFYTMLLERVFFTGDIFYIFLMFFLPLKYVFNVFSCVLSIVCISFTVYCLKCGFCMSYKFAGLAGLVAAACGLKTEDVPPIPNVRPLSIL